MKNKQHSFLAELGNLLVLAQLERQKRATTKDVTHQDAPLVVVQERQPKASVNGNDTKQS